MDWTSPLAVVLDGAVCIIVGIVLYRLLSTSTVIFLGGVGSKAVQTYKPSILALVSDIAPHSHRFPLTFTSSIV